MRESKLDEAVEVALSEFYGDKDWTRGLHRDAMRAALLAGMKVLLGEPVAWTVVGPDRQTSIGGWVDMRSFDAMRRMATMRDGDSYAFAYAPSLGEGDGR